MAAIINQTAITGWVPTNTLETYNCTLGNMMNNSEVDRYTSGDLDIGIWVLLCPMAILGNFLLLGLAHYERFGGDPQKRSLGNRIASQAALSAVGLNSFRTITFLLMR